MADTFKVRLEPRSRTDGATVVFHATPEITEARVVNYKAIEPVHMPGAFQAYNNSSSRTFGIQNIKLFSRTPQEAALNLARINQLRGWTVSKFGSKEKYDAFAQAQSGVGGGVSMYGATNEELLDQEYQYYGQTNRTYSSDQSGGFTDTVTIGLPPAVLELSAYSNNQHRGNIYKIPVVITNLTIPYPTDVDYIPTTQGTPFPVLMNIGIDLVEVHSPSEYERFSIVDYRRGELLSF